MCICVIFNIYACVCVCALVYLVSTRIVKPEMFDIVGQCHCLTFGLQMTLFDIWPAVPTREKNIKNSKCLSESVTMQTGFL